MPPIWEFWEFWELWVFYGVKGAKPLNASGRFLRRSAGFSVSDHACHPKAPKTPKALKAPKKTRSLCPKRPRVHQHSSAQAVVWLLPGRAVKQSPSPLTTGNVTHSKDPIPDSPKKQNYHSRSTETRSRDSGEHWNVRSARLPQNRPTPPPKAVRASRLKRRRGRFFGNSQGHKVCGGSMPRTVIGTISTPGCRQ